MDYKDGTIMNATGMGLLFMVVEQFLKMAYFISARNFGCHSLLVVSTTWSFNVYNFTGIRHSCCTCGRWR